MRIALVHSYYSSRQPSGENVVVDAQAAALAAAGHEVTVVSRRTDDRERRRTFPIEAAWTVATGAGPDPTAELRRFRPDVVHVHNLFPNFGTRWLAAWPGPVVATLHNFRPMCAAGTLFRAGKSCTACPDGDPMAAVRHGCYRGSRAATVPVAIGRRHGLLSDPLVHRADALIVLTEAARAIYREYGIDSARLHVVPNFVDDPHGGRTPPFDPNGRWVVTGRLTEEKGVAQLLAAWPEEMPLDIIGTGPLEARLRETRTAGVRFLGARTRAELRQSLPEYTGLIFPGRGLEGGYPLSVLEALAAGLPVVAVEGSTGATLVSTEGLGAVIPRTASRDKWRMSLASVAANRKRHSERCRAAFEHRFGERSWLETLGGVYSATLDRGWVRS